MNAPSGKALRQALRFETNLFGIALAFFTRIPVPWPVDYSQANMNRASRYFPLVGWLVGGAVALVTVVASHWFPVALAVALGMLFSVLLTGAFHEDGLADTADGLGGGWTKEKKLSIMKDSRLGTYGAVAIWFALSLKILALWTLGEFDHVILALALITAHPLSRVVSTLLIFSLPYVSDAHKAKSKPLAESQQPVDVWVAFSISVPALFVIPGAILWLLPGLLLIAWSARTFLKRQIGGFTGDTLGAVQQVSELACYLLIIIATGAGQ